MWFSFFHFHFYFLISISFLLLFSIEMDSELISTTTTTTTTTDKKQSAPRCSARKSRAVTKVLHLPAVQPPVQTALQQQDVPVASQSTKGKRASAREPKQGSVMSSQVRTSPSPNHSSSELQAGKRTKQISTNPAHVKKNVKRSKTFPVENASNVK